MESYGTYSSLFVVNIVVLPTSQYTQFKEHTFLGTKSIPKEIPNLLDGTGPNMCLYIFANIKLLLVIDMLHDRNVVASSHYVRPIL
jgi:hypothetical protein